MRGGGASGVENLTCHNLWEGGGRNREINSETQPGVEGRRRRRRNRSGEPRASLFLLPSRAFPLHTWIPGGNDLPASPPPPEGTFSHGRNWALVPWLPAAFLPFLLTSSKPQPCQRRLASWLPTSPHSNPLDPTPTPSPPLSPQPHSMATTTAPSMYPEEEAALRTPFPLTPPALGDEFYPFGGERQQTFGGDVAAGDGDPEEADLGVLLQRKEQDLLLAAELGKMLLERNEELERRFEELAKEHMETKERLEQEKHELRLHLESRRDEFETRVAELETDLATVRAQLGQKRMEQQDTSRESSQAVLDLSEQNQRLVEQLSQVAHREQRLQEELALLRGEHRTLSLSSAEHAARAQSLQAENLMLQERMWDLEKQTHQLREENESIQALVDTLHNNLLLLRNESREKELRMQQVEVEAEELRASNRRLQHQVKEMKEEIRLHDLDTSVTSIQSEIESSLEDAPGAPGKAPKLMANGTCNGSCPTPTAAKNPSRRLEEEGMDYAKRMSALSHQEQDLLRQKEAEIMKLQDQITLQYVELCNLKTEIESQRRLYQESNRDEALKLAIVDRDEAIIKKGEMELELAKVSLERDSMSQQLLRVIRQKMALSQELEAWQDDIQYIIHQQLLQKHQDETHSIASSPRSPAEGKNPPFYRRGASIPNGNGFFSLFRKS